MIWTSRMKFCKDCGYKEGKMDKWLIKKVEGAKSKNVAVKGKVK